MTDNFAPHRHRLLAIAYRMLGSRSDAEDAVQETALKWLAADQEAIVNAEAWMVRCCTRKAIDILRRRKRDRADYVGPWLPEPSTEDSRNVPVLAESIRLAFLLMLERLSPTERASLLLRDVFDVGYDEIALTIGTSEVTARQHVARAQTDRCGSQPLCRRPCGRTAVDGGIQDSTGIRKPGWTHRVDSG